MDSTLPQITTSGDGYLKNIVIIILLVIVVLLVLGINIFTILGDLIQQIVGFFQPAVAKGLSYAGYGTGTVINTSSDVLADTSKTGIDIARDSLQSIGNLLLQSSDNTNNTIDSAINQPPIIPRNPPSPNETTNNINSPSSAINKWCLVGEYNGARGCISITDRDKCLSGQVFPQQQMCLNPNLTANVLPK
jgi:hypothetical protein